jgi:GR25 family glycosyltransferase involved in LPS biosynthesis
MKEYKTSFTRKDVVFIIENLLERPDMLIQAVSSEDPEYTAEDMLQIAEDDILFQPEEDFKTSLEERDKLIRETVYQLKDLKEELRLIRAKRSLTKSENLTVSTINSLIESAKPFIV